jgi:hypothetical protein
MKRRGRILIRRVIEKPRKREGTFVIEADIQRSEELRPDRLGPTEDDVVDPVLPNGAVRPSRTLT